MHRKVGKAEERKLKLCANDEATADAIVHYCLVRKWIDETRLSKNPTVEPIRVEGLQPFARVKGMKVESLGRAVR